jgi:hypothetical protein
VESKKRQTLKSRELQITLHAMYTKIKRWEQSYQNIQLVDQRPISDDAITNEREHNTTIYARKPCKDSYKTGA